MSLRAALQPDRQYRRLLFAAAARAIFPYAPNRASDPAHTDRQRADWVLGLADRPLADAAQCARAHQTAIGTPAARRLADAAAFADLLAQAEPVAAAWLAAGLRLLSVPELSDEHTALRPLADATPPLVWARGAALQPAPVLVSAPAPAPTPADADPPAIALLTRPRVALLNSRKPRLLTSRLPWVLATRAGIAWRAARDNGSPPVAIGGGDERWEQLARAAARQAGCACIDVLAHPLLRGVDLQPLPFADSALAVTAVWPDAPALTPPPAAVRLRRDDLILALATEALVLSARAGGNWHSRLADLPPARRAAVQVIDPAAWRLAEKGGAALIALGCREIPVLPPASPASAAPRTPASAVASAPAAWPVLSVPAHAADWPYLTHFTRRPAAAWPDESLCAWLARLLTDQIPTPPTALDALARLVGMRKLFGARQFLRHGPAVCFTQFPPGQLMRLPADRLTHRGLNRPLYEPFGITLRREYLLEQGVQTVIYGDEQTWRDLPAEDRFRFQAIDPAADHDDTWQREGEWRLPGDLDFADADRNDFFLVVPDAAAAADLAARLNAPDLRIHCLAGS